DILTFAVAKSQNAKPDLTLKRLFVEVKHLRCKKLFLRGYRSLWDQDADTILTHYQHQINPFIFPANSW
ncbi:MAG: hypothetical protein KJ717_03060, partial [Proteobacteria bacterium]|nr:hypothetical protein [Pseudomonadota bacterium]